jgi:predicted AAA+ superfamily ATPase
LNRAPQKLKRMSKPEKIFPGDTNLMHALVPAPDVGALRETFFANQLRAGGHDVLAPDKGDFLVDGKFLFEIGGSQKGFSQVKDIPDSYIASDGIELGFGNKIPLWLFGCLY